MKLGVIFAGILAVLFLSPLAAAASVGPLLQVLNSSTTPDTVYSGTIGYLTISLKNTGDTTASSTTAYYTVDGVGDSIALGDISAGSSAQVAVPFKISPESAGGIQVVSADVSYLYSSSDSSGATSSVSSKKIAIQVPILVSQPTPLEVRTLAIDKASISAGESISFNLSLLNIGGVINNLVITAPSNSTFVLDGTSQKVVGTIPPNDSRGIALTMLSSSTTPTGTYTIPVTFTFYDRLQRPTAVNLGVGPVSVLDSSTQYRLEQVDAAPMEVGSQSVLHLKLTNTGTRPISATVDMNATEAFTPIGLQRLYYDSVQPNQSVTKDVSLGISSSAAPGYYTLPLKLTPSVGSPVIQYAGIAVAATPQITMSIDNSGSVPQLTVANSGNSPIRSVDAIISSKNNPSSKPLESFIGTLNVDDYSNVALSGVDSSGAISVEVRFKDSTNTQRSVTKELDTGAGFSVILGSGAGGNRSFNGSGRGAFGGSPLGNLFGGRPGGANASSPIPVIVGVLALIVAAYLLWRWWDGKKKKEAKEKERKGMIGV